VDGPNWGVLELRENDEYEEELVNRLAVKKVGKTDGNKMTVFELPWDTNEITKKTYELEPGSRQLINTTEDSRAKGLTSEESEWLVRSNEPEVSVKVSKRLEDLGYG